MEPRPACDLTLAFLRVLQWGPSQLKGRGPSCRRRSVSGPQQGGGERFCWFCWARIPPPSVWATNRAAPVLASDSSHRRLFGWGGAENNGASVSLRQTPGAPLEAPPLHREGSSSPMKSKREPAGRGCCNHLKPPKQLLQIQLQTPPSVFFQKIHPALEI